MTSQNQFTVLDLNNEQSLLIDDFASMSFDNTQDDALVWTNVEIPDDDHIAWEFDDEVDDEGISMEDEIPDDDDTFFSGEDVFHQ